MPVSAGLASTRVVLSITLPEITDDLMARMMPQIVLSPLVWEDVDVLDTARHLHALGFLGEYKAICPALPEPALILAEVKAIAPGLDFGMLQEARATVAPQPATRLM